MHRIIYNAFSIIKKSIDNGCVYHAQNIIYLAAFYGNISILQYLNESPTGYKITKDLTLAAGMFEIVGQTLIE